MKGIIYCNQIEAGLGQFKKIIEDYDAIGIKCEKPRISTNQASTNFDNGDSWVVTRINNGLGQRCNIAYIDRNISNEDIDEIIMPTIILSPYQAYRYYNWGNW